MSDEVTEIETLEDGLRKVRQTYWAMVRDYAEDIQKEIKAGDIEDREALTDHMHELCDGAEWVIYTFKAQLVLLCSPNDTAGPDSLGADGFDWKDGIPWSALAYFALEADIYEHLETLDVDINEDDLGREALAAEATGD